MSTDDLEGSDGESTFTKKTGKKKHYPFGTPSHLHHPYSQFSHLDVTTKIFAENLAKATGIEAQVLEEEKKPARKRIVAKPAAAKQKEDNGEDDETVQSVLDEIPDNEGEEPCTKIPCQVVLRQLVELQLKNQMEKLEIEDRYEMLLEELKLTEQEVIVTEGKLEKANEIANLLETKSNNLQTKVETLEKSRDFLTSERTEINQKVMLMEIERQKLRRKLEQSQKALSDAMWRKKKKAKEQDVADGYSLATSVISEYPIVHSSQKTVNDANSVAFTPYNRLARGVVKDYIERPPTVKTVPEQVVEKMIKNSHQGKAGFVYSVEEATVDKYSKKHYKRMIEASKQSWEAQDSSIIGANATFYRNNNSLLDGTHRHTGGHHDTNHHSYSASNAASDLLDEEDMRTVVFGPPKENGLLNNYTASTATQRMGNYLQTRSNLSTAASIDTTKAGTIRNREYDCTNQTMRLTKSLALLTPIHKPMHNIPKEKKSMRLSPLSRDGPSSPSSESYNNLAGHSFAESASRMSGLTNHSSKRTKGSSGLRGLGSTLDDSSRGHSPPRNRLHTSAVSVNSLFTQSTKLDPVFYKADACAQFARNHPIGHVRVIRPSTAELAALNIPNLTLEGGSRRSIMQQSEAVTDKKPTGKASHGVHGKTLTVKHPGMNVFDASLKL